MSTINTSRQIVVNSMKCQLSFGWKCSAANALASAILERLLHRLPGLPSPAVPGREKLLDSRSNADATDTGWSRMVKFVFKGRDSNRSFTISNLEAIDDSKDVCSSSVALICSSTCFALKTCDADMGLIGGGARDWPVLGLLRDTLSRISNEGRFWNIWRWQLNKSADSHGFPATVSSTRVEMLDNVNSSSTVVMALLDTSKISKDENWLANDCNRNTARWSKPILGGLYCR